MSEPCIELPLRNGQTICVGPLVLRPIPDPRPWIRGIDAVLAHDVQLWATFHAVADTRMSPELQRVVEPALKAMEQAITARLPEGMTLHTHG